MRVIFTDLDGTLLDATTYSFEPARSALLQCRAKGVPVVFCTSKTRAETEHFRRLTGNEHPFIVENGGAVYVPGPCVASATHSNGVASATHSNDVASATHSNDVASATHSNDVASATHSNGVASATHSNGVASATHSEPRVLECAAEAAPWRDGHSGYFRDPISSAEPVAGYLRIRLGKGYEAILQVMDRLKAVSGGAVRGFHDMTAEDVASRSGLPIEQARLAREREFDEPFVIERDEAALLPRVAATVVEEGMQMSTGGRFHHLHGGSDKGEAVAQLLALYRREFETCESYGIGDAANDLPMLRAVDRPFAVARPGGACDPALKQGVPRLEFVPQIGPEGWSIIVQRLLGTA